MAEITFDISEINAGLLFGDFDSNIKQIEKELNVRVSARGDVLKITGSDEAVVLTKRVFNSLCDAVSRGEALNEQNHVRHHISC